MRLSPLLCPLLAAGLLALAPPAGAAEVRYAELTVAVPRSSGEHVLAPQRAPFAFDLAGARWRARPGATVALRARATSGRWSPWTTLAADTSDAVAYSDPVWLPGSRVLQIRVRGPLRRVRIALVAADRRPLRPLRALAAAPAQPEIVSRAGWGADEALKRAPPRYAATAQMVFIHHTDTPNGYAAADVPAIIRSIYTYHVRSNGWNDIGYNFLVDAYGRVFEGRAGGIDRPVIGAQTLGFNAGSVGIAMIGNGALAPLTTAARDALTRLIAWRLDVAHVDPLGHATLVSGGNDRFAAGKSATFRVVSGHRDALATDCPGALIYGDLDAIAAVAQATGSPKIVDVTATPSSVGVDTSGALAPIAFRGRVLGGATWTVTVVDEHGAPVASGSGSGSAIEWTWSGTRSDGTPLPAGTPLAYRVEARDASGVGALPLFASLGAQPTAVQAPPLSLSATVISPDGDGVDEGTVIGYTLPGPSTVTLDVTAPDGTVAATLVAAGALPAGGQSARWGGEGPAGLVADGIYGVRLSVTDALGQVAQRSATVSVIRAVRKLKLSRLAVGRNGAVTASWQQTQEATLSGDLSSQGRPSPAGLISAVIEPGPQTFHFTSGQLAALPDGAYTFALRARTAVGEQILRAAFRLDRRPPSARLVRVRLRGRTALLVVRLPEDATVRVLAGSRVVVARKPRRAGLNGFRFRLPAGVPARIRLQLVDPAGNSAGAGPFRPATTSSRT
jgi:hypothetical protein